MTIASFRLVAAMITIRFFFGGGTADTTTAQASWCDPRLVVVYVISFFLMQALSRYREFAADRTAALITGRPSALASALMRISGQMQRVPEQDLRQAEGMNAFFIVPAGAKASLRNLFSTHPPMEARIEALNRIEAQLQAGGAIAR